MSRIPCGIHDTSYCYFEDPLPHEKLYTIKDSIQSFLFPCDEEEYDEVVLCFSEKQ